MSLNEYLQHTMKSTTKIFCIGFQKTGTTSLGTALEILGYNVCGVRYDLVDAIRGNQWEKIDGVIMQYDAFKDNPWPVIYQSLDEKYPGSKFILTVRDDSAWIKSLVNHFGTTPSVMQDFIYGKAYPKGNEELYLNTYRKHNREVLAYFENRKEDLLVMDLTHEKDWNRLCQFLDQPVPPAAFPHENKGKYTATGKFLKYLRKKGRLLLKKLKLKQN